MKKSTSNNRSLKIISYVLSALAAAMFVYSTFLSNVIELQTQGIFWFGITAVCAILPTILPHVTKLKMKDFEIEFREKLESVEKRVDEIEDAFIKSFEALKREEEELPPAVLRQRNRHWDRFDDYMKSLDETQRFEAQRKNSLIYLENFGITVKDLKEKLAILGYYKGEIDNVFSRDLAQAIEDFQSTNNMRHVDGMFGELTFAKISERLADLSNKGK